MAETATPENVESAVVDAIASFGPEKSDVTRDATFESLEVDSLDLAELSQIVEEKFGVSLKGADVSEIKTVGDAVDLIVERAGSDSDSDSESDSEDDSQ
jgi:acyl carrier protein